MDPQSPEKKLSTAEIQRRIINAARSEYFEKKIENGAADAPEKNDIKSVPSKQAPLTLDPYGRSVPVDSAPLGPPPPLKPTTFAVSQGNLLRGIDNF